MSLNIILLEEEYKVDCGIIIQEEYVNRMNLLEVQLISIFLEMVGNLFQKLIRY